ncbi:MAG TPA: OmpH family outer membrane protein [Spirochaetia bacterium]|nr:OmpH family outer membrane protein [Spirochaetia bacterium]
MSRFGSDAGQAVRSSGALPAGAVARKWITVALVVVAAGFFAAQSLSAQQLTTVAVVDLSKVTSTFFAESQAVRDLKKKADDLRAEIARQQSDIQQLQQQKLAADQRGDNSASLQLEDQISKKQAFLEEFRRIKQEELNRQQKGLLQSNSAFYTQMYTAVSYVAESLGYSVVFDISNPNLLWWSPTVDITNQVIDRLRSTNNQ